MFHYLLLWRFSGTSKSHSQELCAAVKHMYWCERQAHIAQSYYIRCIQSYSRMLTKEIGASTIGSCHDLILQRNQSWGLLRKMCKANVWAHPWKHSLEFHQPWLLWHPSFAVINIHLCATWFMVDSWECFTNMCEAFPWQTASVAADHMQYCCCCCCNIDLWAVQNILVKHQNITGFELYCIYVFVFFVVSMWFRSSWNLEHTVGSLFWTLQVVQFSSMV